jgi:putative flippase GtrA
VSLQTWLRRPGAPLPGIASTARRAARFLAVGACGVGVNQGGLMLLHGAWPLPLASAVAVECSILGNFLLNSLWTWRDQPAPSWSGWARRALQYHAVTFLAAIVNVTGLVVLVRGPGLDYRIANLIAIGAGSALTFVVSDRWVFRGAR